VRLGVSGGLAEEAHHMPRAVGETWHRRDSRRTWALLLLPAAATLALVFSFQSAVLFSLVFTT